MCLKINSTKTQILSLFQQADDAIRLSLQTLQKGGVILFPTESVYGLGVDSAQPTAIERLYAIKKRPPEKLFQWLVSDLAVARSLSEGNSWNEQAERLAQTFWPGPLTLVVQTHDRSIGWRVPRHTWLLKLLRALKRPLIATSANEAGKPAPKTFEAALVPFHQKIDIAVNGGTIDGGVASTVVAIGKAGVQILREGAIPKDEIHRIAGIR